MRHPTRLAFVFVSIALLGPIARGDDAGFVDNPLFAGWAHRKAGASVTYVMEVKDKTGKTVDNSKLKLTFKALTIDGASVGMDGDGQSKTQTIPDKLPAADVKAVGEEEIEIGGKKYKCKKYELPPAAIGGEGKDIATVWVCDDVVGGIVKMTGDESAMAITVTLSASDEGPK